jgi:hypothetical protein
MHENALPVKAKTTTSSVSSAIIANTPTIDGDIV